MYHSHPLSEQNNAKKPILAVTTPFIENLKEARQHQLLKGGNQ